MLYLQFKHSYNQSKMKKSTFKPFLILSLLLFCFGINAQNPNLWTKATTAQLGNKQISERASTPQEFQLFSLNERSLKSAIAQAPNRDSRNSNVIIKLPTENGAMQSFRVYEASNFEPALQAKHANTRSYAAQGIDDPSAVARFSVSDYGFSGMITSAVFSTIYIDTYTQDRNIYIAYSGSDLPQSDQAFECMVTNDIGAELPTTGDRNADDGMLRTFRLALASTGEYSQWHLTNLAVDPAATDEVKKAAVLSRMNEAMTRVNGVYERDLAVTMIIIDDNEDIIFLNAATDPYTNNDGYAMLNQNQTAVDGLIGDANYDIGHVFSTGGGGIAQLRSPCVSGSKARGVTGLPVPFGDKFYIDYVCHEMGHQFGANHTFNNSCSNNRNNGTAYEPGSGSTILSYAGICPPNVQNFSDAFFHSGSIQEIWGNLKYGQGQCGVQSPTGNLAPIVDVVPNRIIPKSTPFILTGSATDPDGDALTYTWEQMNAQIAPMPPQNTSTVGPNFRTLEPSTSPSRYMPKLQTVLTGSSQNQWEVVPAVARVMNFRFTVRDNAAGGGASARADMAVTVDGVAGPFLVTSQATTTTWQTYTAETITWDVAGTDVGPVDSPNVDIVFSTDSGETYPITLALNVPNNGSALIDVPNLNTIKGRIMVRSSNNIFYNVNKGTIIVEGELGTNEFTFDNFTIHPNPSNGIFNLSFKPASSENIEVSLYDLRGRLINQFTYDEVSANGMFNKQMNFSAVDNGMYFLVVKNGNKTTSKKLIKN